MSDKTDIDSILLANFYFLNCQKVNGFGCREIARKYLTQQINKTLTERKRNQSVKVFSFFKSL